MSADDLASAKTLVRQRWQNGQRGPLASDVEFWGPAPIGRCTGRTELEQSFYSRCDRAFSGLTAEPYLFLGGEFEGQTWIAATGNLVGRFVEPFCGIPPSGEMAAVRYGEFCRVVDGDIVEIRCLLDLLALAASVGIHLLPPFSADDRLPVGPAAIDGCQYGSNPSKITAATLGLVDDMLGGCNRLVDGSLESMGMAAYWHDDMVWYGPWGVGTTHGFDEFQQWAQGPSVRSFPNRRGGYHQARFADGYTAAFTGWPSLQGTFSGEPFRGIAPTGGPIGQSIMDFYVRRGDRLAENWVLIDLIDFAGQCGVDLLEGLDNGRRT